MNHIDEFITFLVRNGCEPADYSVIKDDDIQRYYQLKDDKNNLKRGSCALKVETDGRSVGWCHNQKYGETFNYSSLGDVSHLNPEELRALKRKAAESRKEMEKKQAEIRNKAAKVARTVWRDADDNVDRNHPYLKSKGVPPIGIRKSDITVGEGENERTHKNCLIIPMRTAKPIVSYQAITESGFKIFLKNGKKQGSFFLIHNEGDSFEKLIICEGYATGVSLYMAAGIPVACAFDSGNLQPAMGSIVKEYPTSKIIFAADNDQWGTDRNGEPYNVGLEKAKHAAKNKGHGAVVIKPDFPIDDPDKRTDFNDMHQDEGLESIKQVILSAFDDKRKVGGGSPDDPESDGVHLPATLPVKKNDIPPIDTYVNKKPKEKTKEPWELQCIRKTNSSGHEIGLDQTRSKNYALVIQHSPELGGIFSFDEFSREIMVVRCPPWEDPEEFFVRPKNDTDDIECSYSLQEEGPNQLMGSKTTTIDAIVSAAYKNKINPAKDFFQSLEWDGVGRLDTWLQDYCGATKDNNEYVSAVGAKWMIAAVGRVMDPGCKFDNMLILEGAQGSFKSTLLSTLATFGDGDMEVEYFTDSFSIKNCRDPKELMKLAGCLIVEIAEMADFSETSAEDIKWFIAAKNDRYKPPYARTVQTFHRSCVFAGSYNPSQGMFVDPTGNRRFWPVAVRNIDIEGIKEDKDQIWAEAVHRYNIGEKLYLPAELEHLAKEATDARMTEDVWAFDVEGILSGQPFVTIAEVMAKMSIPMAQRDAKGQKRIGNILRSLGYDWKQKSIRGIRQVGYFKDPFVAKRKPVVKEVEIPLDD